MIYYQCDSSSVVMTKLSIWKQLKKVSLILSIVSIISIPLSSHAKTYPPDQKGPYNVGFMEILSDDSGLASDIIIWYPTHDAPTTSWDLPNQEPNCIIPQNSTLPLNCYHFEKARGSNADFDMPSVNGARRGATVAAGQFPLIVFEHGGANGTPVNAKIQDAVTDEHLASHGFIVAAGEHGVDPFAIAPLMSAIITCMTTPGQCGNLSASIDVTKIGASGISFGGGGAFPLAIASDPAYDARVKAMYLSEPAPFPFFNVANIGVPLLIQDGSITAVLGNQTPLMNTAVIATPRYQLRVESGVHVADASMNCYIAEVLRNLSLANQVANHPGNILEPLTTGPGDPGYPIDEWASQARYIWEIEDAEARPGIGSFREICNQNGVALPGKPLVINLDVNPADGFTDDVNHQGPYDPYGTLSVLGPYPAARIMFRDFTHIAKLYKTAFFKAHLAGDATYKHYLTPGYAHAHEQNVEFLKRCLVDDNSNACQSVGN